MLKVYTDSREAEIGSAKVYAPPYQELKTTQYVLLREKAKVIKLEVDYKVKNVVIRPQRYKIKYETDGENTIYIYPDKGYNFSVEPNGKTENSILIFNKNIEELNREEYENVLYFGKGRHFLDEYTIKNDNTLVYIEEGGVVDGVFRAEGKKNLGFAGYGTITLENYDVRTRLLGLKQCENIKLQNLIFKDSTNWNIYLDCCKNIQIDNVKILGCFGNSDGIDICSCENVSVKNCFMRTWDDCLVIKGLSGGRCNNLRYKDCVLWNDFARPMEIGVETSADEICDIVFDSIDVIHSGTRYPIMGIHHGDRAKIHDVCFENIVVEDTPGAQPFDIRITHSAWNKDDVIGNIRNVLFKNITFTQESNGKILPYHSRIQGYSKESDVSNIIFENITFGDKTASTLEELGVEVLDFVSDVNVRMTEGKRREMVFTSVNVTANPCDDGWYDVLTEIVFENKWDAVKEGKCRVVVSPEREAEYDPEISYKIFPHSKTVIKRNIRLKPGRYAFSLGGNNCELEAAFCFLNLALKIDKAPDKCPQYFFKDNFGNSCDDGVRFALDNDCLIIESELLCTHNLKLYACEMTDEETGEMLFSIEESNNGDAPALTKSSNGNCAEAPQIGCPEEISFVFKNYPKVDIKSTKLRKRLSNIAYVPLKSIGAQEGKPLRIELVIDDWVNKRYDFSLFGSPIPKETIREPRVMAHMFLCVIQKQKKTGNTE